MHFSNKDTQMRIRLGAAPTVQQTFVQGMRNGGGVNVSSLSDN
jgi:hypothetical protein